MKKVYLLFILFVLNSPFMFGETIQIGSGTATNTTMPITSCWGYSYTQQIFTKAQINTAGNIEKIRFYYVSGTTTNNLNWTVYLGHTTKTSFESTTDWVPLTGLTQVFSGNVTYPAAGNWLEITLSSPFAYNNVDNLVVGVDENTPNYTCSIYWRSFSSGANTGIYYRDDVTNPNPSAPPTASGRTGTLAQVQFEIIGTNPSLSVSPSSLAFGYSGAGTPSASQSYVLSGVNLTAGPIVVTAPDGFQVSTDDATWASSLNVTYTPPTLGNTTIYARFNGATPDTPYAGNISHVGGGATKNVAVSGTTNLYSAYCTSAANYTGDEDIFNVTVGSLNNTSTCATVAPGVGSIQNKYSNYFFDVPPVDLQKTGQVNFSVQVGTCGTINYSNAVKIFIDYNQDGDFADSGETVYTPATYTSGPHTESGSFIVPETATVGYTMMRVVNVETTTIANILPCGSYGYGETEDYKVNIVPPPPFVMTPESHSFSDTYVDFYAEPATFAFKNNLATPVNINSLTFTGTNPGDFMLDGAYSFPTPIAPGATVTFDVKFSPQSTGDKSATLQVNETNGSHDILLDGTGYLNPPLFPQADITFPNDVQLNWQAPLPGNEMKDDDGSAEDYYWVNDPATASDLFSKKMVVPTNGTLTDLALLCYAVAPSQWASIQICPESAPGVPNLAAPLYTFTNVDVTTDISWIILPFAPALPVTAGQVFYVVTSWPVGSAVGPFLGVDLNSNNGRSAWTETGGATWSPFSNWMIRAYMNPSSKAEGTGDFKLVTEKISGHGYKGQMVLGGEDDNAYLDAKTNGHEMKLKRGELVQSSQLKTPAIYAESDAKNGMLYTVRRGLTSGNYDTEFTGISGTSYLDQSAAPGTAYYYAIETAYPQGVALSEEVSVATPYDIPFLEDVAPENPLVGWNQTSSFGSLVWGVEPSDEAGELPNEFVASWVDSDGVTRLISPPINTSGGEQVFLFFRHFFNAFGFGVDYKIQTSADGINWTDESWGGVGGTTNVGPETVYFELLHNLGQLTYVAWVLDGDHYQYDYWHVDDIQVTFTLNVSPVAENVSCFGANDGTIDLNIEGGVQPYTIFWQGPDGFTSDLPSVTGLAPGTYLYSVTDANLVTASNQVIITQPDAVPAPTVSNLTVTYDGAVHAITATAPAGTELVWFDAPTGGNATTAPSADQAGVYTAWVAAHNTQLGCLSELIETVLTINKKGLTVAADNKTRCQFNPNPDFTLTYTGFAAGEGPESLETAPVAATAAIGSSPAGNYPITVGGGVSNNYAFTYVQGTLTVTQSPSVDAGPDGVVCENESFTFQDATAGNYTSLLWSSSGDGTFSSTSALNPIYTPGSADVTNGSVILTLTGDPGSLCSQQSNMTLTIQSDLFADVDIVQVTEEVCVGTETHFMAIPVNGGLTPSYQWKVNGINAGTNSSDFAFVPNNGDVVTVVMTSSFGCALNNPATSDPFEVTVVGDLIADVSIFADATTVCDYTPVTYTAIPVNGGSNPTYQWYVNGLAAGTNAPVFSYEPLNGDEIFVEMISSHSCAVVTEATSNIVTMQVAPPYLELFANPTKGGTVAGTGNYPAGAQVTVVATASPGWEFLNWKNADGTVISTNASYVHTIIYCYEALTATFSSTAKIAGQLKYFNNQETIIPSPNNHGVFYAELYEGETVIGERQLLRYNIENGLDSYYEYIGVESGKDYKLRIWEQATNNQLGNVWTWNNWGGTTANDALIIGFMTANNPILTQLPWIAPVAVPNYTPLFSKVADMNNSNSLTGVDALLLQYVMTGAPGYMPLPGGAHNFRLATTRLPNHGAMAYPNAPELLFTPFGNYQATTTASDVYHEVSLNNLSDGLNVFNIYLVSSGDVNASYKPGINSKMGADINYDGLLAAKEGEVVIIPVKVNQSIDFAAMSIGFNFDNNHIEVLSVENYPIHYIDNEASTVKVAWVDQQGKSLSNGDDLMLIKARIVGNLQSGDRYFELMPDVEFADINASVIGGVGLTIPYIESGVTGLNDSQQSLAHSAYPNPFRGQTRINYLLPEAGKVKISLYNNFGQEIKILVDENLEAGSHQLLVNSSDLKDAGQYFYRISLDGLSKFWTVKGTLIYVE